MTRGGGGARKARSPSPLLAERQIRMWYQQTRWRERLAQEVAVMTERFPVFILQRGTDGTLWWDGVLEPLRDIAYRVAVKYPADYPYSGPSLWLLEPRVESGSPHVYQDGSLCVHKNGSWNPATGTAASTVPLLSAWLYMYSIWRTTGMRF